MEIRFDELMILCKKWRKYYMNEYEFAVIINGVNSGTVTQEGETEQEAFRILTDEIEETLSLLPVDVSFYLTVA